MRFWESKYETLFYKIIVVSVFNIILIIFSYYLIETLLVRHSKVWLEHSNFKELDQKLINKVPFFDCHEEVGDLRRSPASSCPTFLGWG